MTDTNNTPNTNDPQDLINAALGTTTPSPAPEPSSEPQPTPELPATPSPTIETQVMPSELTEAPALPTQVTMGDDTPLAFVGSAPAATTPTTEPVVEPTMPVSLGTSAPMDAVPPVVPISTLPIEPTKPKKSKLKVIGLVVALFVAVGVIGSLSYQMLTGESLIAILQPKGPVKDIDSEAECSGESNGGWLVWRNGKCKVTGISGSEVPGKNTENPATKNIESMNQGECQKSGSGGQWCSSVDSTGKSYAFCMKNDGSQGTCNNKAVEKGYTIFYGAGVSDAYSSVYKYQCGCGSAGTFWFDRPGVCNAGGVTKTQSGVSTSDFDVSKTTDPAYYDKWGLCGLVTNKDLPSGQKIADYFSCFNCDSKGCHIISSAGICSTCTTVKYTCKGQTKTSCLDNATAAASSSTSSGKCGTVEQMDVMCGTGIYIASTTVLNGACDEKTVNNPSPSPSTPGVAPKLMCDGLTRTPTTTPVIGDKLTFTCTGSSVPAGSVSLTYKFRSAIDGGVWSSLANKTATTAEMTINACGSYKIQCQACGTISGAVVCDPVWTGASAL